MFLFFINQFYLFFLLFFKIISNFSAYYSLISIENGRYSLISKPNLDPLLLNGIQSNVRSKLKFF